MTNLEVQKVCTYDSFVMGCAIGQLILATTYRWQINTHTYNQLTSLYRTGECRSNLETIQHGHCYSRVGTPFPRGLCKREILPWISDHLFLTNKVCTYCLPVYLSVLMWYYIIFGWGWNCKDSSPRGGHEVPSLCPQCSNFVYDWLLLLQV